MVFGEEGAFGEGGEAAVEVAGLLLQGLAPVGRDVFLVGLLLVGIGGDGGGEFIVAGVLARAHYNQTQQRIMGREL